MNMTLSERELDLSRKMERPVALRAALILMDGSNLLSMSCAADLLHSAHSPTRSAQVSCALLSADGCPVQCSTGHSLAVDGTWDELTRADLVLVFGKEEDTVRQPPILAEKLRQAWLDGATVGGIGAGLRALADAGLLDGRRFSLHWAERSQFAKLWPDLDPSCDAFCLDRRIATCPDGPLVTDMMLRLLHDRLGVDVVRGVMQRCMILEHRFANDPQKLGASACPATDHVQLNVALKFIAEHFQNPDVLKNLGRVTRVSRRHLERLFRAQVGNSPAQHVLALRLGHAQRLLARTTLPVAQIASIAGFQNSVQFSKKFRRQYGHSPHKPSPYV